MKFAVAEAPTSRWRVPHTLALGSAPAVEHFYTTSALRHNFPWA